MSRAAEEAWYKANACTHAHCPDGCEHPQPFLLDGAMICGRCFVMFNEIVPVRPCGPEDCETKP